jgi:hypothetical protein
LASLLLADDKKIAAKFVKDETKMGKGIEEEEVNK